MALDELVCEIRNHIQAAEIAAYMASLVAEVDPEKAMALDKIHAKHISHAAELLLNKLLKENNL